MLLIQGKNNLDERRKETSHEELGEREGWVKWGIYCKGPNGRLEQKVYKLWAGDNPGIR